MKYDRIDEDAVGNGMLFVAGDELFQLPNADVFEETTALVMHLDIKDYDNNAIHFMLSEDTYFQNYGSLPSEVRIDFDDGEGFQVITFGQVIHIQYSSYESDKNLKVEVDRGSATHMGGLILKHNNCTNPYNFPDPTYPVPWTTDNDPNYPWQISINAEQIKGNAYLALSEDGVPTRASLAQRNSCVVCRQFATA
jgi:hypothetical protein